MTSKWMNLLLGGFILHICSAFFTLLNQLGLYTQKTIAVRIANIGRGVLIIPMLVYLSTATAFRFSKYGEIISGDYMVPALGTQSLYMRSTGNFLKIWMIIVWAFVIIVLALILC